MKDLVDEQREFLEILAKLERLSAAATPTQWDDNVLGSGSTIERLEETAYRGPEVHGAHPYPEFVARTPADSAGVADGRLIVEMRNALPELIRIAKHLFDLEWPEVPPRGGTSDRGHD